MKKKRIGVVGHGHLGQYLTKAILESEDLDLAFVWNRDSNVFKEEIEESLICRNLREFSVFGAELIVEVAHPVISEEYGELFLQECDYMVGSPTALASPVLEAKLRSGAKINGLYIPAGALWGSQDIAKMADNDILKGLKVTMKKHPSCFRLESPLREINESVTCEPVILYEGPVRGLCSLAPNNTNTMAAAAIAGHNLGFDGVVGCLVADPSLKDWHIVETEVTGPSVNGNSLSVSTVRKNPANFGVVTGSATYQSFLASIKRAGGLGPGVHLC
ncbi:UNVERIFIED_CONTAM: hypothetical protein RMT77_008821 [Armadillidium vulgare]